MSIPGNSQREERDEQHGQGQQQRIEQEIPIFSQVITTFIFILIVHY